MRYKSEGGLLAYHPQQAHQDLRSYTHTHTHAPPHRYAQCTQVHTCTYTHNGHSYTSFMHTPQIHPPQKHAYMYAYTQICTHMSLDPHTNMCTCTHSNQTHICTYIYIHVHGPTSYRHVNTPCHRYTCTHRCAHMYTQPIHTHVHTRVHGHTPQRYAQCTRVHTYRYAHEHASQTCMSAHLQTHLIQIYRHVHGHTSHMHTYPMLDLSTQPVFTISVLCPFNWIPP